MDNEQRDRLSSFDRITKFNADYSTDLASLGTDYSDEVTKFAIALKLAKTAATAQQVDGSGNIVAADAAKLEMGKAIIKYARKGLPKSRNAHADELTAQLDHPISYIVRATKAEAIERASVMKDAMNANKGPGGILVNITAAYITEMDTKIATYDDKKDEAVTAIETKKSKGTDPLPGYLDDVDAIVLNMFDYVYSGFEDTKPTLVDAFSLAKQVISTGVHHTSIIFTLVSGDGSAISNGEVEDVKSGKIYKATIDSENIITIPTHVSGKCHFIISAPGKAPVDLGAQIKRGTKNEFTVKLV